MSKEVSTLRFNLTLYSIIYAARSGVKNEYYCFALRRFLGHNGLYENHELKGKTFKCIEDGTTFVVDDVYVHWYLGWYYVALARNMNNSHVQISWNINSTFEVSNIENYELVK